MTTHLPDWLGLHSPLCLGKISVFCNSFMMLNLTFFVQGYLFIIPSVSWTDLDCTVHSVWVKFQYFSIPSWWFISPFLSRATSSLSHLEPNCSLGSRPSWFSGHLQDGSDSVLLSVSSLEKGYGWGVSVLCHCGLWLYQLSENVSSFYTKTFAITEYPQVHVPWCHSLLFDAFVLQWRSESHGNCNLQWVLIILIN